MKKHKQTHISTVIRYSCVTGKAVWVYFGRSERSAREIYKRACANEIKRIRLWKKRASIRSQNITHLLNTCVNALPIIGELTSVQRQAIFNLRNISNMPYVANRDLVEHIHKENK